MKIFEEKQVLPEVNKICDVCEETVIIEVHGEIYAEFGELSARFGHGSQEDGNAYHLDLCEKCFKTAIFALQEHRRAIVMFDDTKELPNDSFGLVST
ncbi:hypothetical protein [Shewanella youngdeokensis]|uniref:Uncharacterized protein n=1 Tax=Shewanella youngdeokensis TaxID=2999068 RepID=A0ABZ0JX69_9GAMM|nr:hypothetical protein RGE70_13630 [Shewanella sp. DAU334]